MIDAKFSFSQVRCKAIRSQWDSLLQASSDAKRSQLESLACEVLVFPRAVELAIELNQFYQAKELESASELLDEAERRLEVLTQGGDWADVVAFGNGAAQQLIVGGYRSKLDGAYQPYGLVVPAGMSDSDVRPRRLDLWFHGRGEKLSEVVFLSKQRKQSGEYTPDDTLVLHPYGRYSNAFKFAGEIDVLEVLDYISTRLPVDRGSTAGALERGCDHPWQAPRAAQRSRADSGVS